MSTGLRVEIDGTLGMIIFAREKGLNILSTTVLKEIDEAWSQMIAAKVRVCILRGEGKAFLAGADIKEMSQLDGPRARDFSAFGQSVFDKIENSDIVSIAAIHGACLGGGCELSLACDIRIGSTGMMIGQPEVNIGLVPGFGGSQRLPRVVGDGWALRMILSGEPLNEQTALTAGLITEYGDPADLPARAEKLARTILSRGPEAIWISKKLARLALNSKLTNGLGSERSAFGDTFDSGEAKEGMTAFLEKRPPNFK
jgi:enoyl-CoA hydratase